VENFVETLGNQDRAAQLTLVKKINKRRTMQLVLTSKFIEIGGRDHFFFSAVGSSSISALI